MALCFGLGGIDGSILASPEIFLGGPRLRTNNFSGDFDNIFSGSVVKRLSLDMGKRFDRSWFLHGDSSPKQFVFFSGIGCVYGPCRELGMESKLASH